MKKLLLVTYAITLFIVGCDSQEKPISKPSNDKERLAQRIDQELSEDEKKDAAQAVRSLMQSYNNAMDELDAEKMLSHFKDSPDFVYTRNGKRKRYHEFVEGCNNLPKIFEKLVCSYDSIYIDVITHDVAIATVAFDETLTNFEKEKIDVEGTMSWTALKRNGKWLFIHGHSFREF